MIIYSTITDEQKKYVIDNYLHKTINEIKETLGITEHIYYRVLKEFGLERVGYKEKTRRGVQPWEDVFVRLTYPDPENDIHVIAYITGRTLQNLRGRVRNHLKIYRMTAFLPNQRQGKLVIKRLEHKDGEAKYFCHCDCGKKVWIRKYQIEGRGDESCGCGRIEKISTGYGKITGTFYRKVIKNAESRELTLTVSAKDLDELFAKQGERCALTGLKIKINTKRINFVDQKTTASVDRIDSKRGYELDNVQFLNSDVNYMKMDYDEDEFLKICALIFLRNKNRILSQIRSKKRRYSFSKKTYKGHILNEPDQETCKKNQSEAA